MPRRAARHPVVLERVWVQGTRRGDPARGSAPRRARPAASHPRAPGRGDRPHPPGRAPGRAVHGRDRGPAPRRGPGAGGERPRAGVHRPSPEPGDGPPARPPRRGRRSARRLGEGADGERLPGHEPHRERRGLRRGVPRVRRLHRRPDRPARGRRPRRHGRARAPRPPGERRGAPAPPAGARPRTEPHHRRAHHDEPAARQPARRAAARPRRRVGGAGERRGARGCDRGEPAPGAAGAVHPAGLRPRDGGRRPGRARRGARHRRQRVGEP